MIAGGKGVRPKQELEVRIQRCAFNVDKKGCADIYDPFLWQVRISNEETKKKRKNLPLPLSLPSSLASMSAAPPLPPPPPPPPPPQEDGNDYDTPSTVIRKRKAPTCKQCHRERKGHPQTYCPYVQRPAPSARGLSTIHENIPVASSTGAPNPMPRTSIPSVSTAVHGVDYDNVTVAIALGNQTPQGRSTSVSSVFVSAEISVTISRLRPQCQNQNQRSSGYPAASTVPTSAALANTSHPTGQGPPDQERHSRLSDLRTLLNTTSRQLSQTQASNNSEWALVISGRNGQMDTWLVNGDLERWNGRSRRSHRGVCFALGALLGFIASIFILCILVMQSNR